MSQEPVLAAEGARISVDDVVAIDQLTFTSQGDRVLCVGDVHALMAALTGVPMRVHGKAGEVDEPGAESRVVSGTLRVAGRSVADGAHHAVAGIAPLDPALPGAWTAEEYVRWSARLAGVGRRLAVEVASTALARIGIAGLARKQIRSLSLPERRALMLAQAAVGSPAVIIAEAPLAGLDGGAAAFVATSLGRATEGRAAIVSVARLDPGSTEGALARGATHVLVLSGGELTLDGPPGEIFSGARIYGLTVRSNADVLRTELSARGVDLRGGPLRYSVALPAGVTTNAILAAAAAARAAIVEMVPLV